MLKLDQVPENAPELARQGVPHRFAQILDLLGQVLPIERLVRAPPRRRAQRCGLRFGPGNEILIVEEGGVFHGRSPNGGMIARRPSYRRRGRVSPGEAPAARRPTGAAASTPANPASGRSRRRGRSQNCRARAAGRQTRPRRAVADMRVPAFALVKCPRVKGPGICHPRFVLMFPCRSHFPQEYCWYWYGTAT